VAPIGFERREAKYPDGVRAIPEQVVESKWAGLERSKQILLFHRSVEKDWKRFAESEMTEGGANGHVKGN